LKAQRRPGGTYCLGDATLVIRRVYPIETAGGYLACPAFWRTLTPEQQKGAHGNNKIMWAYHQWKEARGHDVVGLMGHDKGREWHRATTVEPHDVPAIMSNQASQVVLIAEEAPWLSLFRGQAWSVPKATSFVDAALLIQAALLTESRNQARNLESARAIVQGSMTTATPRLAISSEVKTAVWRRDEGRCTSCSSNQNLEFDHIIPLAMGGANTLRNLQLLCETCNRTKGANIC
jgi:hypothetical protein